MHIRETRDDELEAVLTLYPLAFPDEELRPVVRSLLSGDTDVLSLAALEDENLIAHLLFTLIEAGKGALLAPLGVVPNHQQKGVGTALVKHGLQRLSDQNVAQVFVLGDPAYYGRFGFAPEPGVLPPYPLPDEWAEAWQSLLLGTGAPLAPGPIVLPAVWMEPALWGS